MALHCDWCDKPIYGKNRWGYQVEFRAFHSLGLGETVSGGPNGVVLQAHVHPKPCREELGWAVMRLLEEREPLETDGPTEDEQEVEADEPGRTAEEEARERAHERWRTWKRMSWAERERAVLEALGEDRLTVGELQDRMNESPDYALGEGHLRGILTRLRNASEVDRKAELRVPGGTAVRYRYFRRRKLEGPIVDLQRTFDAPDDNEGRE